MLLAVGLLTTRGLDVVARVGAVHGAPRGPPRHLARVTVDGLAVAAPFGATPVEHVDHAVMSVLVAEPVPARTVRAHIETV